MSVSIPARATARSTTRTARRPLGSLTHPARTGRLLVAPACAFVVVFVLGPLAFAIVMSFTSWPLIGDVRFAGLRNWAAAFTDLGFLQAVGYTLLYTVIVTPLILVLGYVLAALVRRRRRGTTLVRTLVFLPYVIGLSTLSFLTVLEAQPNSGAVNVVLKALGVTDGTTAWLVDARLGTVVICALVVWAVSGLTMLLLAAGMQAIPREVYEAADLDGASWWQQERRVTMPMVRRTVAMSLLISVIGSLLAFTQFYVLTAGGPGRATTPAVLYVYNRAFVQLQLGSAAALSVLLVVVIAVVTAVQIRVSQGRD